MQDSMPLPANGGAKRSNARKKSPAKQSKWTLLNLLTTWFLSDQGKPVIVDPKATGGASHDEWRELVKRTRVRITPEHLADTWGALSRRDFLNWCEENLPVERRPALFASKEEALAARDFSNLFDGGVNDSKSPSKRFEISKSDKPAPEDDGDDTPDGAA
jgi:hypothetical protein